MTAGRIEGGGTVLTPRDRMVRSAAQLIRRQGVSGTGMREIVVEAGAPRGSLQHYFPGGKEELVSEALLWMGAVATRRLGRHLERLDPATPGALLAAMADEWRSDLTKEGYAGGCPLLAAAADTATTSDRLRGVLRQAFDSWEQQLGAALVQLGVPAGRAPGLATLIISALEGAIVLARIRRDLTPLDTMVAELAPVLDGAASTPGRPRR